MPEQSAHIHHRVVHVPRHKRIDSLSFPGGADLITELRHQFPNGEAVAQSGSFTYRGKTYDATIDVQKFGVPNSTHAGWSLVFDRSKSHRSSDETRTPSGRAILVILPTGTTFLTTQPPELIEGFLASFRQYISDPKTHREFVHELEAQGKIKPRDGKKLNILEATEQKQRDLLRQKHMVELSKIATAALQAKPQAS